MAPFFFRDQRDTRLRLQLRPGLLREILHVVLGGLRIILRCLDAIRIQRVARGECLSSATLLLLLCAAEQHYSDIVLRHILLHALLTIHALTLFCSRANAHAFHMHTRTQERARSYLRARTHNAAHPSASYLHELLPARRRLTSIILSP